MSYCNGKCAIHAKISFYFYLLSAYMNISLFILGKYQNVNAPLFLPHDRCHGG